MNKIFLLTVLYIFTLQLSSLDIYHGLSFGHIGIRYSDNESVALGEVITYKVMEKYTNIGLSLSLLNIGPITPKEEQLFRFRDPICFELSWDPFYWIYEELRFNIFLKTSEFLTGKREISTDIGLRIGGSIPIPSSELMAYPLVFIEGGINNFSDLYFSVHMDLLLFLTLSYGIFENS